jgi:maltodextrin utilization protein YvdJ
MPKKGKLRKDNLDGYQFNKIKEPVKSSGIGIDYLVEQTVDEDYETWKVAYSNENRKSSIYVKKNELVFKDKNDKLIKITIKQTSSDKNYKYDHIKFVNKRIFIFLIDIGEDRKSAYKRAFNLDDIISYDPNEEEFVIK